MSPAPSAPGPPPFSLLFGGSTGVWGGPKEASYLAKGLREGFLGKENTAEWDL